jgi:K+-sensing histidine kinase KdpD
MYEYIESLSNLNLLLPMGNHDLLAGLSAIGGSVHFALQQIPSLTEEQYTLLLQADRLADSCRRLLRTKITLQVALTSSNFQGKRVSVRLNEVLQEAISALENPQNGYSVKIKADIQDGLPAVYAHPRLLYLLFHTLMSDALPFRSAQDVQIDAFEDHEAVRLVLQPLDLFGSEHLDLFGFFVQVAGGTVIEKENARISFTLPRYK